MNRLKRLPHIAFLISSLVILCGDCQAQDNAFATVVDYNAPAYCVGRSQSEPIVRKGQRVPMASTIRVEGQGWVLLYSEGLDDTLRVRRTTPEPLSRIFGAQEESSIGNLLRSLVSFAFGDAYPGKQVTAKDKGDPALLDTPMLAPEDGHNVAAKDGDVRFTWSRDRRERYQFLLIDDTTTMHIVVDTMIQDTSFTVPSRFMALREGGMYIWTVPRPDAREAKWFRFFVASSTRTVALEAECDSLVKKYGLTGTDARVFRMCYWRQHGFGVRALGFYQTLTSSE